MDMEMKSLIELLMETSNPEETTEATTMSGDIPRGAASSWPPYFLDLVKVWRSLSLSASAKAEEKS
jgi:hypothetical protein